MISYSHPGQDTLLNINPVLKYLKLLKLLLQRLLESYNTRFSVFLCTPLYMRHTLHICRQHDSSSSISHVTCARLWVTVKGVRLNAGKYTCHGICGIYIILISGIASILEISHYIFNEMLHMYERGKCKIK